MSENLTNQEAKPVLKAEDYLRGFDLMAFRWAEVHCGYPDQLASIITRQAIELAEAAKEVVAWASELEQAQAQIQSLQAELTTLREEKAAAVQDAVADVLRQIRQPLHELLDSNSESPFVHIGIMEERTRTNEAADTLAKRYGVNLGEWPTYSDQF